MARRAGAATTRVVKAPTQGAATTRPASRGSLPQLSEKDTKLAQKLGQLQPFIAVFPQESWANLHCLGQPNTFLALAKEPPPPPPLVEDSLLQAS
jgi:hypothetical protein